MGRGNKTKKRKATSQDTDKKMWSSSGSSSRKKASRSKSGNGKESAADRMFNDFCDPDDPSIATMEGISKLCESLGLDISDIRILVLMYKMGAAKPAQISRQEWVQGCSTLKADSVAKFKKLLPSLDTGFMERSEFRDFYKFCFQFNRQGTHRTLDKDLVVALVQLCLEGRIDKDRLKTFCEFLESQQGYTHITLDQWTSFLDFSYECEDLSTYDEENSAWPVLIDDYVDYMKDKMNT